MSDHVHDYELREDDWVPKLGGWRCSALKGHKLTEIRVDGRGVSMDHYRVLPEESLIRWIGEKGAQPAKILVILSEDEKKSRESHNWRLPVFLAVLGIFGSLLAAATRPWWCSPPPPPPDAGPPQDASPPVDAEPPKDAQTPHPNIPGMIWLRGGEFSMGSTPEETLRAMKVCGALPECSPDKFQREEPPRKQVTSPFFIDITEVSVERYAEWLRRATNLSYDATSRHLRADDTVIVDLSPKDQSIDFDQGRYRVVPKTGEYPAVYVTWEGANRYCRAVGKRLPTSIEWEFAARGSAGRIYPWGDNEPSCDGVVVARRPYMPCAQYSSTWLAFVGISAQDQTPDHVRDLGGNVQEWVADPAAAGAPLHVTRGGSWAEPVPMSRGAHWSWMASGEAMANIGFRCASDG